MKSTPPFTSSIYKWIGSSPGRTERPSRRALADRAMREALPDTRDITGKLVGDPPPGRSALDKKREAERRAAAKAAEEADTGNPVSEIETPKVKV